MQSLSEFLHSIPVDFDREEIYKKSLPYLVNENYLNVLSGKTSFKEFHTNLISLAKLPHGIGIGVALMAQINIAGRVIQIISETNSNIFRILEGITKGEIIVALGVSEPEWKGRLSNLKSTLTPNINGKYLLNGEKSFFTNGYNCNFFLVVVKIEQNYRVLILDKNKPGLQITRFTLPFAVEATHCKIKFENVEIENSEILNFNYSEYAENLRLSEMLSLAAIFCGYSEYTLNRIKENTTLVSILKDDESKQTKLLRCKTFIQLLKARILEISEEKDKNPQIELKSFFPYGTEFVVKEFYSTLEEIFPSENLEPYFQDKLLFQYKDMLNESYIRRAGKTVSGITKSHE
ncbi:MAG: acyl-CoA dehydrogenase family protein [Leptospiraceae bacterium]|nr:acyl-CoA dehydrogenase family protein [Leptospiraceae bacterium]